MAVVPTPHEPLAIRRAHQHVISYRCVVLEQRLGGCTGGTAKGCCDERGKTKLDFVEGDHEIAEGLTLFDTPGHTIAHVSLLAEPEGRAPMIFAGDAVYTQETLDKEIIGGFHFDPVDSIAAIKRIKEMARQTGAEIFPSHEMASWNSWKHAPEFYGA